MSISLTKYHPNCTCCGQPFDLATPGTEYCSLVVLNDYGRVIGSGPVALCLRCNMAQCTCATRRHYESLLAQLDAELENAARSARLDQDERDYGITSGDPFGDDRDYLAPAIRKQPSR